MWSHASSFSTRVLDVAFVGVSNWGSQLPAKFSAQSQEAFSQPQYEWFRTAVLHLLRHFYRVRSAVQNAKRQGVDMRPVRSFSVIFGLILGVVFPWQISEAATVTLDFASVTLPPGGCIDASSYLASFGITFVPVSAGANSQICSAAVTAAGVIFPVSSGNYFFIGPTVTNTDVSGDLVFSTPLTQISFVTAAASPGISEPAWDAKAYDASGALLSSVSEPSLFPGPGAMSFTLTGPGITRFHFDAFNSARRSFNAPPIDHITLTEASSGSTTTDFTSRAAFDAATSNLTTIGFTGILPPGVRFGDYGQLDIPGVSFSTPTTGAFVNVTTANYYSPNNYPGDFIVNSVNQVTGQPNPNNTLVIALANPTLALGLDLGGLGFAGVGSATITLSNGHVFNIPNLPSVGHTTFVGFISTGPITSLTIAATNDSWVLEDFLLARPNVSNCTFSLLPGGESFNAAGGIGSFKVNTGAGCAWNRTFSDSWITPIPFAVPQIVCVPACPFNLGNGPGPGTLQFAVAPNAGAARGGTITVGGQQFQVKQDGAGSPCTFSISPSHTVLDDTGGDVRVVITAPNGCQSTSVSNVSWLTVTSGASGGGTRAVVLHAGTNTAGARAGTATIAGQIFSVSQGAGACGALDVTAETRVSSAGGLSYVPFSTYLYTGTITVINTSVATLHPPLFVVLVGLPNHLGYPAGNGVIGAAQTTCFTTLGDAMYLLPVGDLPPGSSIQISPLFFTQSLFGGFPYSPRVLSGNPSK